MTLSATENALARGQEWLPTRSVSTPSGIDAGQAIHTLMLMRPLTIFAGHPSEGIMKPLAADVKSGIVEEKTLAEVPAMS